jgi:hypothetical protein
MELRLPDGGIEAHGSSLLDADVTQQAHLPVPVTRIDRTYAKVAQN